MDASSVPPARLFGRQRPMYDVLGRGRVADVLMWRNKRVSTAILIGNLAIWILFQVVEYNLVTLLCHVSITTMLLIFIWSTAAEFFKWKSPDVPRVILQDSTFRDVASTFHKSVNDLLGKIIYVATGNDPKLFLLTIVSLWIISVIGSTMSSLNLLFFGFLCVQIIPFMYEQYEEEVDDLAHKVLRGIKKTYKDFETEFLGKIPRGTLKDKNTHLR